MNEILVSEKLYITPEMRKKKRMYKIDFFISVFLVVVLLSYYIYNIKETRTVGICLFLFFAAFECYLNMSVNIILPLSLISISFQFFFFFF